jgi:hypothetical protein
VIADLQIVDYRRDREGYAFTALSWPSGGVLIDES